LNEPNRVALYDGQTMLGTIVERGPRFEAITPAGKTLGLFNTAKAAADALHQEHHRIFDGAT
jgi:hypothetical protein